MYPHVEKCSIQLLKTIFSPLDKFPDYVFWLRNADMYQQLYVSSNFDNIWKRNNSLIYDIPLIWFEFLSQNDKTNLMKRFQERHLGNYLDPKKNIIFYRIDTPDQNQCFLYDETFKCQNAHGTNYIFGISKLMPEQSWEKQMQLNSVILDDQGNEYYQLCFKLLKVNFGITAITKVQMPVESQTNALDTLRTHLSQAKNISLSKRELECLYYLCQGKTAKQTAQKMQISHRTVETFLDNIRCKTTSTNKMEVIRNFSHYFQDMYP